VYQLLAFIAYIYIGTGKEKVNRYPILFLAGNELSRSGIFLMGGLIIDK